MPHTRNPLEFVERIPAVIETEPSDASHVARISQLLGAEWVVQMPRSEKNFQRFYLEDLDL